MGAKYEVSERGFRHWDPVKDTNNSEIQIYESSSAQEGAVWLAVYGNAHLFAPAEPCAGVPFGVAPEAHSAAHLNYDQAVQVRDQLDAWIGQNKRNQ